MVSTSIPISKPATSPTVPLDAGKQMLDFLDRSQSGFYAIVLFVLYVLCFVYMDSARYPNTEQLSIGMFLGLHIILFLYFLIAARTYPAATATAGFCAIQLPKVLRQYWSGTISIAPIFVISWVLMIAAMSLFVQMYVKLKARFTKDSRPVDLGGNGHVQQKESIKSMLIANTVLLWILTYSTFGTFTTRSGTFPQGGTTRNGTFTSSTLGTQGTTRVMGYPGSCNNTNTTQPLNLSVQSFPRWIQYAIQSIPRLFPSRIQSMFDIPVLASINSAYNTVVPYAAWAGIVSVSTASLILSSLTVWKAQQLALDMGTITNPQGGSKSSA